MTLLRIRRFNRARGHSAIAGTSVESMIFDIRPSLFVKPSAGWSFLDLSTVAQAKPPNGLPTSRGLTLTYEDMASNPSLCILQEEQTSLSAHATTPFGQPEPTEAHRRAISNISARLPIGSAGITSELSSYRQICETTVAVSWAEWSTSQLTSCTFTLRDTRITLAIGSSSYQAADLDFMLSQLAPMTDENLAIALSRIAFTRRCRRSQT